VRLLPGSESMTQGVLNFAVASTDERLTPRAGEIVFGEYLKAIGLDRMCNTHLPLPQSNKGYAPFAFVQPLILMLHSGGKSLEDLRTVSGDNALCQILKIDKVPTADGTGKWLRRHGLRGVYGMERINRTLLGRYLNPVKDGLVLDIDATVISSQKRTAEITYKMEPGYTPMIGHINGGYVVHSEFRSGNIPPADHNLSFVQRCIAQLPKGRSLSYLRADSASYQHALFDYCEEANITYTIGARLDSRILENIQEISRWQPLNTQKGEHHYLCEEVAEFWHTMEESEHAFRIVVVKKSVTPLLPNIWEMLSKEERLALAQERYHVIATNADPKTMDAGAVVHFYRQRGDRSENRIKELKGGFHMDHLPSSDFIGNAFYFQIVVLAYNLFLLFKKTLHHSWQKHTIQTLRYKLYNIAGKVITHSRQTILKVQQEYVEILTAIRQKIYIISLE